MTDPLCLPCKVHTMDRLLQSSILFRCVWSLFCRRGRSWQWRPGNQTERKGLREDPVCQRPGQPVGVSKLEVAGPLLNSGGTEWRIRWKVGENATTSWCVLNCWKALREWRRERERRGGAGPCGVNRRAQRLGLQRCTLKRCCSHNSSYITDHRCL